MELRTAIVLGDGSALASLIGLARVGFGAPQVDGPVVPFRPPDRGRHAPREPGRQRDGHAQHSPGAIDDILESASA